MLSRDEFLKNVNQIKNVMISERRSPRTIKQYSFLIGIFFKFIDKDIMECTPKDIEKFKFYLATERNYSKNSQYLAIQAVKYTFKVLNLDIPRNLTTPRRTRKVPSFLSIKESNMILEINKNNLRKYAMVRLLLFSGIRVSELCNLKTEDLDLDTGSVRIVGGKGDKERIVLISEETLMVMRDFYKERIENGVTSEYFFTSQKGSKFHTSTIEKIVRESAKEAGIVKRVTPHVLRHTFATNVLKNGGDIRFIQKLLGHASIGTTEIYTHIDDETMREMFKKYGPKY
jgi:integrase/recombinase XerD